MNDAILTAPEVARYLKLSKAKVYALIQRQELPHLKIGKNVRVRQSELEKWLQEQTVNTKA